MQKQEEKFVQINAHIPQSRRVLLNHLAREAQLTVSQLIDRLITSTSVVVQPGLAGQIKDLNIWMGQLNSDLNVLARHANTHKAKADAQLIVYRLEQIVRKSQELVTLAKGFKRTRRSRKKALDPQLIAGEPLVQINAHIALSQRERLKRHAKEAELTNSELIDRLLTSTTVDATPGLSGQLVLLNAWMGRLISNIGMLERHAATYHTKADSDFIKYQLDHLSRNSMEVIGLAEKFKRTRRSRKKVSEAAS